MWKGDIIIFKLNTRNHIVQALIQTMRQSMQDYKYYFSMYSKAHYRSIMVNY